MIVVILCIAVLALFVLSVTSSSTTAAKGPNSNYLQSVSQRIPNPKRETARAQGETDARRAAPVLRRVAPASLPALTAAVA